jgi:TatD DNase family protein
MESRLFDMHCHLGFYEDPAAAANELDAAGVACFNATVTPGEYEAWIAGISSGTGSCSEGRPSPVVSPAGPANTAPANPPSLASSSGFVRTGVGLHPWWLADGRATSEDAVRAAELAAGCRYVGEVGLDFARGRDACAAEQVSALDGILAACEDGGHLLTLHAVQAADMLLDLLEKHRICENNDVILHWFSGSSEELFRARRLGCYFSVNARMLSTRRGREYARQIPLEHLLVETDLPANPGNPEGFTPVQQAAALAETLEQLSALRNEDVSPTVAATSRHLLQLA